MPGHRHGQAAGRQRVLREEGCKACESFSEDTAVCEGADKKAYDVAVTADTKACMANLSEKTKGNMNIFGIMAMIVVMGFVVVIYLTLRAIKYWRASDDADE